MAAKKSAKTSPVTKTVRPKSAPRPEPEEIEEEEVEEEEEEEPQYRRAQPVRKPSPRGSSSGLHFPQGSLFEGDRNSKVLFGGTFEVEELHTLIDAAAQDSVSSEKVRVKIFSVDEQYQSGPKRRVRLCFTGLQERQQFGNRSASKKPWSKRW